MALGGACLADRRHYRRSLPTGRRTRGNYPVRHGGGWCLALGEQHSRLLDRLSLSGLYPLALGRSPISRDTYATDLLAGSRSSAGLPFSQTSKLVVHSCGISLVGKPARRVHGGIASLGSRRDGDMDCPRSLRSMAFRFFSSRRTAPLTNRIGKTGGRHHCRRGRDFPESLWLAAA